MSARSEAPDSWAKGMATPTESNAGQMARTGIAGVVATVFDYATMLLVHSLISASDALAVAAGYGVGTVIAYIASIRYIFPHRNIADRRLEFAIFSVLSVIGWALTELIVKVSVSGMVNYHLAASIAQETRLLLSHLMSISGPHDIRLDTARLIIAKGLSIVIVFFFNFVTRKVFLFRGPQKN